MSKNSEKAGQFLQELDEALHEGGNLSLRFKVDDLVYNPTQAVYRLDLCDNINCTSCDYCQRQLEYLEEYHKYMEDENAQRIFYTNWLICEHCRDIITIPYAHTCSPAYSSNFQVRIVLMDTNNWARCK